MRYTVNYAGAFWTGDSESFNSHGTNSLPEATGWLRTLLQAGFKEAYVKDEEYGCTLTWNEDEKSLMWNAI